MGKEGFDDSVKSEYQNCGTVVLWLTKLRAADSKFCHFLCKLRNALPDAGNKSPKRSLNREKIWQNLDLDI
jgi:hypothetical protein